MKFSCSNIDFLEAANACSKAASINTNIPVLEGILINAGENVVMTGNDMKIAIECTFTATIFSKGKIVVPAKILCEILRRMPEGTIFFELTGESNVNIKCGELDFNIIGLPAEEFPEIPASDAVRTMDIKPEVIKDIVGHNMFAVAQTELKPILTGIKIAIDANEITAASLDGYRMAVSKVVADEFYEKGEFIIPGRTLSELEKLVSGMDDAIKVNMGEKSVLFEFGNVKFFSRLLEGEFVNYKNLIPKEFNYNATVSVSEFIKSIDRASLLTGSDGTKVPIKITYEKDKITVNCETPRGDFKDVLPVKADCEEAFEVGYNYRFLMDALRSADCEFVKISIVGSINPTVITPVEDDKFLFIVVPVKLK